MWPSEEEHGRAIVFLEHLKKLQGASIGSEAQAALRVCAWEGTNRGDDVVLLIAPPCPYRLPTHTRSRTHTHTGIHVYTHTHTQTRTCAHTQTHIHHTDTHTHIHPRASASMMARRAYDRSLKTTIYQFSYCEADLVACAYVRSDSLTLLPWTRITESSRSPYISSGPS
jgi:hypothetical protein